MMKTYWKGVVLPSTLYGAEVKVEEIDKLQKVENTAMRRILKAPKWTAQAAIRGEIGISNMKARISKSRLLYLRRIETGNNEVLKRILEDSRKHKKSKWWETTRKYMNWAQIEEREIKERTAKEIRGKIANVVEEEWREELEKKNSLLRIYRRFKKRNERGGLQQKFRVIGVVESENKQLKPRRELLAEKQGGVCGIQ